MNTLGKTFAFVGGGIALVAVSIGATLGIQSWQKDHAVAKAPAAPQLAQVIGVMPYLENVQKTVQHCHPVQHTAQSKSSSPPVAGTVLGGLAGGLLGSQIGGGHGRDAAIATGAVVGALAGGDIESSNTAPQTQVSESMHCQNQTVTSQVQKGYDVTYLYNGQQGVTRMDTPPAINSLIPPPVATTTPMQPTTVQK